MKVMIRSIVTGEFCSRVALMNEIKRLSYEEKKMPYAMCNDEKRMLLAIENAKEWYKKFLPVYEALEPLMSPEESKRYSYTIPCFSFNGDTFGTTKETDTLEKFINQCELCINEMEERYNLLTSNSYEV